jgi:hypothetical protein
LLRRLFESKKTSKVKTIIVGFSLCSTLVFVASASEIVVNQSVPVGKYSLNKTRAIFTCGKDFGLMVKKLKSLC